MIWNHGGAPSRQGATRSEEWGNLLAAAGYVVIHPARLPLNDPTPRRGECEANGVVEPDQCSHFVAQVIYGPQTTHFLIEHLADVAALDPALAGLLDGELASSSPAIRRARPWRWPTPAPGSSSWTAVRIYDERDETPPRLPGHRRARSDVRRVPLRVPARRRGDGSAVDSFAGIDRPFMFITGVGDETGEPPESRTRHG